MNQTEPSSPSLRLVRFGVFEVDLHSGELRKNGLKIKLQEQPFQILAMLLERPGNVVTREELRQKLWPADTFVDFDHSLNAAVKKLRQALGDSAGNARFVETLARRGYRFIAPVEGTNPGVQTENVSPAVEILATTEKQGAVADEPVRGEEPSVRKEGRRTPSRTSLVAAFVLIIAGSVWFYAYRYSHKSSNLPPMKVTRFTSYPGIEKDPALSPDGKQIAFVWDGEEQDNFDIYVKLVDVERPLRLTTDPAVELSPAWSPDGRYIAFARKSEEHGGFYIVPSLGGHERKVGDALTDLHVDFLKALDWSPDGEFLAVADKTSVAEPSGIFLISIETGERSRVTFPPIETAWDLHPVFSPDGQNLAFSRESETGSRDLYLVPVTGGEPRRLSSGRPVFGHHWSPDGQQIIFSASDGIGTRRRLWRIWLSSGSSEELTVGELGIGPSVSRQGNRLAYTERIRNSEIWQIVMSGPSGAVSVPTKVITSTQEDNSPELSPAGDKIVFASNRSGAYEIWLCDRERRRPQRLTEFGGPLTGTPRWSPDGRQIAFDSRPAGHSDIFLISPERGSPRRLTSEPSDDFLPSWSRDGKWIYFCSSRSGTHQVWKMPTLGGQAVRITKNGGFEALESLDGRMLYYSREDRPGIWKVPVGGGAEVCALEASLYDRNWTLTGKGIYFIPQSEVTQIRFLSFSTGQIMNLFDLQSRPVQYYGGLTVSLDGRTILCPLVEQEISDIMLVENFR